MKVCFIETICNTLFEHNLTYNELLNLKDSVLDRFLAGTWLGWLYGLKADYYRKYILEDIKKYDIIITEYPVFKTREGLSKDQYLFYIQREPNEDLIFIGEPYDGLLNNFIINQEKPNNYLFWYHFNIDLISKYKSEKTDNIFIQKRTKLFNYKPEYVTEQWGKLPYKDYYKLLSSCKFLYNLDSYLLDQKIRTSSSIVAEAAILDTVSLGIPKLFQRLLFPEYCFVNDEDDLLNKIQEIKVFDTYNKILDYKNERLYLIDSNNLMKKMESIIERCRNDN